MNESWPIVLFVLVFVAIIAGGATRPTSGGSSGRRWATRLGLSASEGDPFGIREAEPGFQLFDLGHGKKVLRVLDGRWGGVPVRVFDYRYKTGSGKEESTHTLTALLAELPVRGERLRIRPEHFGDWIASAFGFDDIDFEYEEFNRRFHVSGDKRFAYDICHPALIEFLLGAPEYCWELLDRHLLLYANRRSTFDPDEVERSLDLAAGFVGLIPDYLRRP